MAESLQFSIGADTTGFQSGISGILTGLAGLAAAFIGVQKVVEAFSEAIEMGGRLHDLSTRTGETAGNLAILERAFENTSVGAEKLGPAIAKMQVNMVEMQKGSEEAVAAFKQLGLTWADLKDKSPSDQMQLIGERLAAIENPALRAETAVKIFGRAGSDLIPILVNFSTEAEEARRQLGSLPDQLDKSAESVDELGDNLSAIRNKLTEMAYGFLSEVIPAVNAFTNKLAGIDAAGLGAELADSLVGAFAAPKKAAESMGDIFVLAAKSMGNEFVYQVRYWSELLFNTFSVISDHVIPMLGNNLTGAFDVSVGLFGKALADVLEPVAKMLGLDFVDEMKAGSEALLVEGFAKITDSANTFQAALAEAQKHSTIMREDFFGVEGSSAKIEQNWQEIQKSGKQLVDDLASADISSRGLAESRTTSETGKDPLISILENENLVIQDPVTKEATVRAKTAAQVQAELNRQLGIIAGAGPTQLIGQSASARRAMAAQKELDMLTALGKDTTTAGTGLPPTQADALRARIQRDTDIALGDVLTAADKELAHQQALNDYFNDSTQSLTELEKQHEADILAGKKADAGTQAATEKAKADAAGAGGKAAPPVSLTSIVNSIQMILQKIEPKIPTHVMS